MVERILIAEDESLNALVLKKSLEQWGYHVCKIAQSGKELIESALDTLPDILLVDIYLNDNIDGIDAVSEIHKRNYIPVIYISGSVDPYTYEKARKTRMFHYLQKPYNPDNLLSIIRALSDQELRSGDRLKFLTELNAEQQGKQP